MAPICNELIGIPPTGWISYLGCSTAPSHDKGPQCAGSHACCDLGSPTVGGDSSCGLSGGGSVRDRSIGSIKGSPRIAYGSARTRARFSSDFSSIDSGTTGNSMCPRQASVRPLQSQ
jgi:hypothetical protein